MIRRCGELNAQCQSAPASSSKRSTASAANKRNSTATDEYDFEMVYFNADGRLGSMCGNGARCTVRFAKQLGVIEDVAYFLAADGEHQATIER